MASLVIKVKYEETLRRFNVAVIRGQRLDISMEGLRLKISSLFDFPANTDFNLTYKDEDNDIISLVDDNDLHDVVRQGLNPVRIAVHLNSNQGESHPNVTAVLKSEQEPDVSHILLNPLSSTSSTPNLQQSTNLDVLNAVRPVQEPLARVLSKLSLDVSSIAATVSPIFADGLSKIEQVYRDTDLSDSRDSSSSSHVKDDSSKNECSVNEGIKNDDSDSPGLMQSTPDSSQASGLGVNDEFSREMARVASEKESSIDADEKSKGFQSYGEPSLLDESSIAGTPIILTKPKRGYCKDDGLSSKYHKGVRCDGCRVLSINGPRFKSKDKCFSRMKNDLDNTRIDKDPRSFSVLDAISRPYMTRLHVPKHLRSGFDSRFIVDVNVVDGTAMAPATPFTKIWRICNNGAVPWTSRLQLSWIGGDRFSPSDSVEIQVPSMGVDVDSELDIAVDFIAPDLPGEYSSFWSMVDPSGNKFGQRMWVHIQVDPSGDLNLPPDSNETAFPRVPNVKAGHGLNIEVGETSSSGILNQNHAYTPIKDDSTNHERDSKKAVVEKIEIEEKMLRELELMGFKQRYLNKEVLQINEYDLGRSVDYLCDVKWNPILEELEDMGFRDKETNKKLLAKNNGSITRVVMDLLAQE